MAALDRVGQILGGKLRVLRLLDTGGMGAVYVAEHLELGKQVAVKLLLPEYATNEDVVRRFAQEARAAAAIGHPGIIDVHDVGRTDDGVPYLVMQLLDGESLRAALARQGSFAIDRAVSIVLRVLSALRAAHAKGIVHRDIKPANIFLEGPRGRPLAVKVLDFGVAKMSEPGASQVTRTGVTLGTGDYMAPEQAQGLKDVDHRVDVWAAGVVLYELIIGRTPFTADNYNAMIAQILTAPIPAPRSLRPDVSTSLDAAILRALERDRDQRFASAEAFARAIAPHAGGAAEWDDAGASDGIADAPTLPAEVVPGQRQARATQAGGGFGTQVRRGAAVALAALAGVAGLVAWDASRAARPSSPAVAEAAVAGAGAPASPRESPRELAAPAAPIEPGAPGTANAATVPMAPDSRGATAPRIVTLQIVGAPANARVFFDGAAVDGMTIRVARSEAMVPLRIEAEGHEVFAKMVMAEHDQQIPVTLQPASKLHRRARGRAVVEPSPSTRPRGTRILTDTGEFGDER